MSKHTPGPWWPAQDSIVRDATQGHPYVIADIMSGNRHDTFLMAAALEMYETLSKIANGSPKVYGFASIELARAAIAKAEGRNDES